MAPELVGADLRVTYRPKSSDLFSLAVHIHQLLLEGEHPFRGRWTGNGEPPAEADLARQGLWTHAGKRGLSPRRSAIGIELLPPHIIALFRQAFVEGATAPGRRPDATTWKRALNDLSNGLADCKTNPNHCYPNFHKTCPWCTHQHKKRPAPAQTPLPPLTTPTHAPVVPRATVPPRAAPSPPVTSSVTYGSTTRLNPNPRSRRAARRTLVLVGLALAAVLIIVLVSSHHSHTGNGVLNTSAAGNPATTSSSPPIGRWSEVPSRISFTDLDALSCSADGFCMATNGGGGFTNEVATYLNGTWSALQDPPAFSDVSCASQSFCLGVDQGEIYSDGSWTQTGVVDSAQTSIGNPSGNPVNFEYVACPANGYCLATSTSPMNAVYTYSNGAWNSGVALTTTQDFGGPGAISCPSTQFCMTSDGTEGDLWTYQGGGWSRSSYSSSSVEGIGNVSCASSSLCIGIGGKWREYPLRHDRKRSVVRAIVAHE